MARSTGIVVTLALLAALLFMGQPAGAAEQGEVEASISEGLAWLALQQNTDGSWGMGPSCIDDEFGVTLCIYGDRVARTGLAVMAFIDYAGKIGMEYDDPAYEYSDEVLAGIEFLTDRAALIATHTADGSIWDYYPFDIYETNEPVPLHTVYETSIAIMALTAAGNPEATAWTEPDGTPVTYLNVVESAVEFLVSAQNTDIDGGDGGWSNDYNADASGDSDQLDTGFVTLALQAVRDSSYSVGIPESIFVSPATPADQTNALSYWIANIQNSDQFSEGYGGSVYMLGSSNENIFYTGHLLNEMSLYEAAGHPQDADNIDAAVDFISSSWNDVGYDGWLDNYPAIYAAMTGLTSQEISTITVNGEEINWLDKICNFIIESQDDQGYWDDTYNAFILYGDNIFDTELALLTLLEWKPIAVGAAPTANGDAYATNEDTTLNVADAEGVLGNDEDTDGETLTAILVSYLGNGVLILNQDGSFSYTPESNFVGTDTFTYVAYDNVESSNEATVTITVLNVPPTVNPGAAATVDEGSIFSQSGSFTDPGADTWTATVDYGDGSGVQTLELSGQTFALTHTYADNGIYTVTVSVSDDGEGSGSETVDVTVLNVNPAPLITPGFKDNLNEGETFTASGSFTDPGADTWTATVDYGDGSGVQPLILEDGKTFSLSHCYLDDDADDLYTAIIEVTDDDGGVGTVSIPITVKNVAPDLGEIVVPLNPQAVGTSIGVSAPFTDPGEEQFTVIWTWDDGSTSAGSSSGSTGSYTATGSHTYSSAGIYTVSVTVADDDGGSDTATAITYIVIYDPNGGFVTGGGWINSPAGAYTADPLLAGKATFGFVSKYVKGAKVPTGSTEFQFHATGMNFHSESYDWLVIAGARAQYKGTGTINGGGSYGFLLSVIDGQVSGGGGTDKFRIKIWDMATGTVTYDNQMGTADDGAPTTAIAGGSIVIHTK